MHLTPDLYQYRKKDLVGPQLDGLKNQRGVTLISVLIIVMVVGMIAAGSMDIGHISEKSAGNAIQRSRAFQAADGGSAVAYSAVTESMKARIFADADASEGVFSTGAYKNKWWRNETYNGEQVVPDAAVLGVVKPPRYIVEELGQFVTDGGTGISSLDMGSAAYGSRSRGGRDVVLYRVESHGTGSFNEVKSVIETVIAFSY